MVNRKSIGRNKDKASRFETDTPVKKREISIGKGNRGNREIELDKDIEVNMDAQAKREKISIRKINAETEGRFVAKIISVEEIPDKEVKIGNKVTTRNVVKVEFELENGHTKFKEMILAMTESSELGRFVKAIKGEIPDDIEDFEKEVLHKDLIVEIKANIKNEKVYYNIVDFHELNTPKKNTRYRSHEDSYNYNIPDEDDYEDEDYEEDEYVEYEDDYEEDDYEEDDDY